MEVPIDVLLRVVEVKSRRRLGALACEFVRAKGRQLELVLAAMEFERWLAESCQDCRIGS